MARPPARPHRQPAPPRQPARSIPRPPPKPFAVAPAPRYSRADLMLMAAGIVLAVLCVLFPWYIFHNPEQFGVRAMKFQGDVRDLGGAGLNPGSMSPPEPLSVPELAPPPEQLDDLATGTLGPENARLTPPGLDEQPFPMRPGDFRLLYVENGRAMIADDAGIWVVQTGSILPDASRVAAIERRGGRWVLVTSADRVVEVEE